MNRITGEIAAIQENKPPMDEEILKLNVSGFNIMESIKIIRAGYSNSLADAKSIVSSHPVWKPIVDNNKTLHDLLEKIMRDG